MQTAGAAFSPCLACSGATPPLHGDYTIATNVFLRRREHQICKSFEDASVQRVDCMSDAHDMVCVVLSMSDTTDAAELGGRAEEEASSSTNPTTADAAELGGATDPFSICSEGDEPPDKSFTEAHEQGLSYGEAAADIANDNMARHIAAYINALEASTTHEQQPPQPPAASATCRER